MPRLAGGKSINMDGTQQGPPWPPRLCFFLFIPYDGSEAKTDHATRMSLLLQEAGAV